MIVDGQSGPTPTEIEPADFDAVWRQGDDAVTVATFTSDGGDVPFRFTVPESATAGTATLTVDGFDLTHELPFDVSG